jgi:serine/threonine protein kinase
MANKLIESRESKISYEMTLQAHNGSYRPKKLGEGVFAFVYHGLQTSIERGARPVAIKILRPTATFSDANLFETELKIMKHMLEYRTDLKLGDEFITALDIVSVSSMIMCGCGHVYPAVCPRCHSATVEKPPPPGGDASYPHLGCVNVTCSFRLSAEKAVDGQGGEQLYSSETKTCCKRSDGQIVNFVPRKALVMDVIDCTFHKFIVLRDRWFSSGSDGAHDLRESGASLAPIQRRPAYVGALLSYVDQARVALATSVSAARSYTRRVSPRKGESILHKALIVERLKLMVDLVSSVERLHACRIVHRDLAPDNIMIQNAFAESSESTDANLFRKHFQAGGQEAARHTLRHVVTELVLHSKLRLQVIDFGLADACDVENDEAQRRWYDEARRDRDPAKLAFWSQEAEDYRKAITVNGLQMFGQADERRQGGMFDGQFDGSNELKATDIVAVRRALLHDNDLTIRAVVPDASRGNQVMVARFNGRPPQNHDVTQFELVPRLGEAHDVYALGAILYHLFVKKDINDEHQNTRLFRHFILSIQNVTIPLRVKNLSSDSTYLTYRNNLLAKYWQDEIMMIAMRAMVRGRAESFAADRSVRGPEPVRAMLSVLKALHFRTHREVIDELDKV